MKDEKCQRGERPELVILDDCAFMESNVSEIECEEQPTTKTVSTIRTNLSKDPFYRPYCGNLDCKDSPRTIFKDKQFECPSCGWRTDFEEDYIESLVKRLKIKNASLYGRFAEQDYLNHWVPERDKK